MKKRSPLADEVATAILRDALEYTFKPVKEKPKQTFGWGTKRMKKRNKWAFKGRFQVAHIE